MRTHAGMVEHHLDHGRHQAEVGHAVLLNRIQHLGRIKHRNDRVGVAFNPVWKRQTHIGQVKHRCGVQIRAARACQSLGARGQTRAAQVVVAQHHPLGETRRAAGVENARQIVTTAQGIGYRLALRNEGFKAVQALGCLTVATVDKFAQVR